MKILSYSLTQIIKCLIILFNTRTYPRFDWFLIFKTILLSFLKNPNTVISRSENSNFLSNFLTKNVVVKSPHGIIFLARIGYEDLVRFLFSHVLAKWEPINEIDIDSNQIFIDIGANVGYYSLKFSSIIGKDGKIIAIEPDPDTFDILNKNYQLNNFQNIESLNLAISEKDGFLNLFRNEKHSGTSSLFSNSNNDDSIKIPTKTLDNLLENRFNKIDLIKIDTEGSELSILKGATNILKITNKILIELHEKILIKNNQDPQEIIQILKNNNFEITTFNQYWNSKTSQNQQLKSDYILAEKI